MPNPFKELQAKGRFLRDLPPWARLIHAPLFVPENLLQPFKEYEERMARERTQRRYVNAPPTYKEYYDNAVTAMMTWRPNEIPVYVDGVQLGFTKTKMNLLMHKLILDMKPTKKVKKAQKLAKQIAKLLSFVEKTTFYKLINEDESGAIYQSATYVHVPNADILDIADKAKKSGFPLSESDLKPERKVHPMIDRHVTTKDIFGSFYDQKEVKSIIEVLGELMDDVRGHLKQIQNLNIYHANTLIQIGQDIYNVEHDGEFEYMGEALRQETVLSEPIFGTTEQTTDQRDNSPY